jgi:hypothetical protein
VAVDEFADANREKRGRSDALSLARSVDTVVVGKGKKVVRIDMREPPDEQTLLSYLLGPTGNLRAPTIRRGKTLLVGFNEDAYAELFG